MTNGLAYCNQVSESMTMQTDGWNVLHVARQRSKGQNNIYFHKFFLKSLQISIILPIFAENLKREICELDELLGELSNNQDYNKV